MNSHGGKEESTPFDKPDALSIVDENSSEHRHSFDYSSELKLSDGNRNNKTKAQKSPNAEDNDTNDMHKTGTNSNETGNGDESLKSPPTNNGYSNPTSPPANNGESNPSTNTDNSSTGESSNEEKPQGFRKFRNDCGKLVNNETVQNVMLAFIIINAIMMGIGTYPIIKDSAYWSYFFDNADLFFLITFTIELLFQFTYHGWRLVFEGGLFFDLIIIVVSWIFRKTPSGVQAFRIFRAFRLVNRVKIMKNLISALCAVLPRMAAIFLMLLLIFYIFGVMFTQHFTCQHAVPSCVKDSEWGKYYFGSLATSLLTLFQIMTMDEWAQIVRELAEDFPIGAYLYINVFVIISGFIVVNLIVAVICEAIGALDDDEKAKFHGGYSEDAIHHSDVELRDQLEMLEDQLGDLTRIQARTFHTLRYLTQQLEVQKEDKALNTSASKTDTTEDNDRGSEEKKDRRPDMLKKERSGERSQRKGLMTAGSRKAFPTAGYSDKRISYRDTWTQEGENRDLRKTMISNFAKSARELQKMREKEL